MKAIHPSLLASALCTTLLALCASGTAHAQTLIDQNKAVLGNVTPGDTPGFPITLSQPGHYVLKSNLSVPDGLSGVLIQTDGVTLDLNGFTIKGGRVCSFNNANYVVTCSAAGGWRGIDSSNHMITVRNGSISGFAEAVWLDGGLAENLTVRHNLTGIIVTNARPGRVTGTLAELNSKAGIYVDNYALVDNAVVAYNTVGLDLSAGSASDSSAYMNSIGIRQGAVRATRTIANKINTQSTSAY